MFVEKGFYAAIDVLAPNRLEVAYPNFSVLEILFSFFFVENNPSDIINCYNCI
jgi:hypothetical protein